MSSFNWSPLQGGSGGGVATYASLAAFPSAAGAGAGALAIALDTGILYEVISGVWTAIAGAGSVLSVGSPANGLSITADVLSLALASTSTTGALSNTDWNTFNNKQSALTLPLSIANGGTNNSATPGTLAVPFFDGTKFTTDGGHFTFDPTSNILQLGTSTVGMQLGSNDAFGRQQMWNYRTSAILRLGALASDGDPFTSSSEGVVSYGQNAAGDPMTSTDFGYARIKPMRFGLYNASTGTGFAGYIFKVDPTSLYLATDAGSTTFSVQRTTGVINSGSLTASTVLTADASKNITSSSVSTTTLGYLDATSSIQTQLNSKGSGTITALTGGVTASGSGSVVATVVTNANLTGPVTSVGNATQVLDSTFLISNSIDPTKQIKFAAANITSGNVRQLTMADASVDLAHLTNANIDAAAQIATSKLGFLGDGKILIGNSSNLATAVTPTGDVTISDTGVTAYSGTVPINKGGTGQTAIVTSPTASTIPAWDANKNLSANNFIEGYRTQATANSTLALVVGDAYQQYFTGTTAGQVVTMPVVSGLVLGQQYLLTNNSTQTISVQSSGGNVIQVMAASTNLLLTCILTSGTGTASWNAYYYGNNLAVSNPPTVQKFTSGSGTYTTPSNVAYIRVRMVGGGGGSSGSGTSGTGGSGGTGGNSTFGSSLLTANGGAGGTYNATQGGTGGTATISAPAIGTPITGGSGGGANYSASTATYLTGGCGGNNPFGGGGGAGNQTTSYAGVANTGGGGGGAGTNAINAVWGGSGGGASGYIDAIIPSPSSTYSYAVGAAGTAGTAGTSGNVGTIGGSGYIEVTEYYNNAVVQVSTVAAIQPTIQKFTTGSGTYTTPAGVQYIVVRAVGGGGGGGGGGNAVTTGGTGGNTTFGTSLLTANGAAGAVGGTATVTTSGTVIQKVALTGGQGQGVIDVAPSNGHVTGQMGASSPFGGAGAGSLLTTGVAAISNTGSGGGGGGANAAANAGLGGAGGGAGGYLEAIITSPSATYAYAVGGSGSAGGAGTNGFAGGAGGSGYIEVTEYYTNLAVGTTTSVAANTVFAGPSSGAAANPTFRQLVNADINFSREQVVLSTYNGYGSTNTRVFRFTNITSNTSSVDLTLTQSAANGDSVTINTAGCYSVSWAVRAAGIADSFAIYRNSTTLAASQNDVNLLAETEGVSTGAGNGNRQTIGCTFIAAANDIIRCVSGGGTAIDISQFRICRVS